MRISLIAAVSTNGVIGRDNALPWHLSADLKRFKALTMGHHLIVGRKTWESIGKPLPGRSMVVLSRSGVGGDVTSVPALEDAISLVTEAGDQEPFIAGGASIYSMAIHRADRMYITRVHAEIEGDAFFPEFDDVAEWLLVETEHCEADERNDYPYSFLTYDRKGAPGHPIPEED